MKIGRAATYEGLTWLTIEGTEKELSRAQQWIHKNRTMWVNLYNTEAIVTYPDGSTATPTAVAFVVRQVKAGNSIGAINFFYRQKLCFKAPSDAMRFKLSHS